MTRHKHLLVFAYFFPLTAIAQTTGNVRGVVRGEDGAVVAHALVAALPDDPSVRRVVARVNEVGGFAIEGLAPGAYSLCVNDLDDQYLDPCYWLESVPKTEVLAGESRPDEVVVLKRGIKLDVRVKDPSRISQSSRAQIIVALLRPGGRLLPLHLTSEDASAKTYSVAAPVATHALFVDSHDVTVADANRSEIAARVDDAGRKSPPFVEITIPEGVGTFAVDLQITGKR